MSVVLVGFVEAQKVSLPGGAAHLSFRAESIGSPYVLVDVDCTISDPDVVFSNGSSFLSFPGQRVGPGVTLVDLDDKLGLRVPGGRRPIVFRILGHVKEAGILQFQVPWIIQVLPPTVRAPKKTRPKRRPRRKLRSVSKGRRGQKGRKKS